MGKGNKKKNNGKKTLPFVSVCTPTFNRRPFIKSMIACFDHQLYPRDKMEWIIIDDGTDPIEDLVANHPNVKYFKYTEKMPLGRKRNIMHEKSKGEIIVYMDDDDYYPPERVSHAVEMLQSHPKALCAGASEIYIYFHEMEKVYQFGPYSQTHGTAGTFAFKRELLNDHEYNNEASLAEEKAFLKNYSVPFVQLEPKKVILVFSHEHNTFDKRKLLGGKNEFIKESEKTVDDFVKQQDLKNFYMHQIHEDLKDYDAGKPEMKPDVIKQTREIEEQRAKDAENNGKIVMQDSCGNSKQLTTPEIVDIIKGLQKENEELKTKVGGQIMMETREGTKTLTNEEIAQLIRGLQQENIAMKEQLKNQSVEGVKHDVENMSTNRQFIFTDENDSMEILDSDEINDYVNKKIDLIKELKNRVPVEQKVSTEDLESKLDEKLDKLKEDFTSKFEDFKTDFFEMENTKNYNIIENGVSKNLDLAAAVKIINAQSELLNNFKTEYEKNKIRFKDQSGEVIQLTQEMFEMIIGEYNKNTPASKDLSPVKEEDMEVAPDEDVADDVDEDVDEDETEDIEVDSHGNNSNNISFKMKKINN